MRTHKDTVVVIKSNDYSEADKILTVFGEQTGKFSLLAKGIRKITSKNRGNMQTLSMSKITFYKGQGMPILMESEGVQFVDFGTEDMLNLERVLVLLNKLLPDETTNKKMFKALKHIVNKGLTAENVNKFRTLFLNEEGMLADMAVCSICGEAEKLKYINLKDFALVCENCYSKREFKGNGFLKLSKDLYSEDMFTKALDRYVVKILEQL